MIAHAGAGCRGGNEVKIAFNLLVLGAQITTAHARRLEGLKALGYDAVEIPVFTGKPDEYATLGRVLSDIGLSSGAAAVATPEANPVSADPAIRQRARDHHRWIVDCTHALGGEVIAGPVHSPVGVFTGFGPTSEERGHCVDAMRA